MKTNHELPAWFLRPLLAVDPACAVPPVGARVGSADRETAAVGADSRGHPYRAVDSPVLPGAGASAQGPRGTGASLRGQGGLRPTTRVLLDRLPTWRCGGSAAGSGRARCRGVGLLSDFEAREKPAAKEKTPPLKKSKIKGTSSPWRKVRRIPAIRADAASCPSERMQR